MDKFSNPTSNLLLAYQEGNYWPCLIINKATSLADGYRVYFFNNQLETEISKCNAIGNFKVCYFFVYCLKISLLIQPGQTELI